MVSKAALAIPIAVGAAGVSLYAYLNYHWRNKKKEDEIPEIPFKDWTEHRMVLNKAYAHLVLGQLEYIRNTSNTLISVLKIPDEEDQTFSIMMKGKPESVQEAEFMVNRLIETSPEIVTNLMEIPKESPLDIINATQQSKYVEVLVSAISTVNKFYIQLYRLSSALVKMERRIADHFAVHSGTFGHVKKPKMGAMVAVPYEKQGKWYRALIVGIDEKNVKSTVRAKFVDYGDVEDVKVDEIRTLPPEFSRYPYFAVECSLAGVLPKTLNAEGEEKWSEEALDFFESLVSDKPNKILMAKKYGEYEHLSVNSQSKNGRKLRCKIPAIELVDTNSSEDVDIALELISKGYARSSIGKEKQVRPLQEEPESENEKEVIPLSDDSYEDEEEMETLTIE